MIIIHNSLIPFRGYKAISLWPFLFVKTGSKMSATDLNHEKIHGRQQLEMLIIPFYIWYVTEWLFRLFGKGNAYRNISFEKEAYVNEKDLEYLKDRRFWNWIKFL